MEPKGDDFTSRVEEVQDKIREIRKNLAGTEDDQPANWNDFDRAWPDGPDPPWQQTWNNWIKRR